MRFSPEMHNNTQLLDCISALFARTLLRLGSKGVIPRQSERQYTRLQRNAFARLCTIRKPETRLHLVGVVPDTDLLSRKVGVRLE